jgi:hypothetical protein
MTGSSTLNRHSAVLLRSSAIWADTRTESLSPTIDSLHLTGSASPSDGRTTPTEANGGR